MATTPIFPAFPNIPAGVTIPTEANTATNGTGTLYTVFTAGATGSRIDYLQVQPTGATVQTAVRVFLSAGSVIWFHCDATVAVTTASDAASMPATTIALGLDLPAGMTVRVCTATAAGTPLVVTAVGKDY